MMKNKYLFLCFLFSVFMLTGCNSIAKNFGGNITIKLKPGEKLEEITWKDDDSLWYLTRPMRDDEKAETHIFKQDSNFGVIEGSVTVIESEVKKR